jgi:hypothetical protein
MLVGSSCQAAIRGYYIRKSADHYGTTPSGSAGNIAAYTPLTPSPLLGDVYFGVLNAGVTVIPVGKFVNGVQISVAVTTNNAIVVYRPGLLYSANANEAISFLVPDGTASRPSWPVAGVTNTTVRFVKGVLGANGKIYYMPFQITAATDQILVLNTNTTTLASVTWSFVPMYNNTALALAYSGGVLGRDGKIYFIPNQAASPFVRLNTNNSAHTWEVSYYDGTVGKRFITNGTGATVYDETGAIISTTDGASLPTATGYTAQTFADAIVHPNGNIYLWHINGKGRIYYCKPSNFNTVQAVCSAPGLVTDSLYGGTNKPVAGYAIGLERPQIDYETNSWTTPLNSLKVLLFPRARIAGPGAGYYVDPTVVQDLLVLDPISNTLTKKTLNLAIATVVNGAAAYLATPLLKTSTGLYSFTTYATGGEVRQAVNVFTGLGDLGSTPGSNTFPMISTIGINYTLPSRFFSYNTLSEAQSPFLGRGCSYVEKSRPSNTMVLGDIKIIHIFANKMHMRNIKYFSYDTINFGSTVESQMYVRPTTITDLPTSLYNSLYNKIR